MRALVVGSGPGGAMAARELSAKGMEVLVLEAGGEFRPMTRRVTAADPLRRTGMITEGSIHRLFPHIDFVKTSDELLLVRGLTTGGCSSLACGNLVRATRGLGEIGLDLSEEFEGIEAELRPQAVPREMWRPLTSGMFDAAGALGLRPLPTPKAMRPGGCRACGLCELGCAGGAKWDSRRWLQEAVGNGARVLLEHEVDSLLIEGGEAVGVRARSGRTVGELEADAVVLAAGGIGTARILARSGIEPEPRLWADIVVTVGASRKGARMLEEPPMAWYSAQGDYMISPYIDILSHWLHRPWRGTPLADRVGLMVKMADSENGRVLADGRVDKELTDRDRQIIGEATGLARKVLEGAGLEPPFIDGMANGGHLGGTVPLRRGDLGSMRPPVLPEGAWVADLSLLPSSQGLPTMLTAAALSKRVSARVLETMG